MVMKDIARRVFRDVTVSECYPEIIINKGTCYAMYVTFFDGEIRHVLNVNESLYGLIKDNRYSYNIAIREE